MTTTIPPRVVMERYVEEHGPTKTVGLAKAAGISETTARKILGMLAVEGKIVKQGALWALPSTGETTEDTAPAVKRTGGGASRAEASSRDEDVFVRLEASGPLTRNDIAEHFGIKPSQAYLSLFRLRESNRVVRLEGGTWAVKI